ncbi:MAG: hypothetical protein MK081_12575 [Flavobacteriales bacterium]|nr:hypothetical protein [Flavobacteriales bacterium]
MHSFSLNVNPCLSCVVLFLFLGLSLTANSQTYTWDYLGSQGVSSGTGEWTELEYNPVSGELYLAFQDEANAEKITVMKHDGVSWSTVGSAGFSEGQSFHPDLEFDSSGNPYVAYRSFPGGAYTVETFDGSSWSPVGTAGFTNFCNGGGTLAIDPTNNDLYLAYPDLDNGMSNRLSVQKWDGSSWSFVGSQGITADGTGFPSIEFDASGTPHVLYRSNSSYSLTLLTFDGTNWNTVGSSNFSSASPSAYGAALKFNPVSNEPWVVTRGNGNVHFAYRFDGTSWVDEGLPSYSYSSSSRRIFLEFDAAGNAYFAFRRNAGTPVFTISVVSNATGTWDYAGDSTIPEDLADYPSMEISPMGEPVIAFRDDSGAGAGKISVIMASVSIEGCTDPTACNYNSEATQDDGSCLTIQGCTDALACNYDASAECEDGSCTYPDLGLDCDGNCVPSVLITVDSGAPASMAGLYDVASDCDFSEGGAWFGGVDYMVCFRKDDGSDWRIWNTGCGWEIGRIESGSWERYARYYTGQCNLIPDEQLGFEALTTTTFYDGFGQLIVGIESELFGLEGCTDPSACNYDANAQCDDGSCLTIQGCTDALACNYDASAECEDGSCLLPDGCTDPEAYNYDPAATCDDGSCTEFGSALNFNGVSGAFDAVNIPVDATVSFGSGAFTIETWFRMNSTSDFSSLLAAYMVSNGGWAFHRDDPESGSNNVRFIVGNAAATGTFESIYTGPLNFGEWYHIAGVRDDNELRLYLNGVLIGSVPSSRNIPTHPLLLGKRYVEVPQWGHNGDLDEVRLWDRALNEDEINARMNCELNGDEPGLVRYYKFNQGEAFGDNTSITTATSDHIANPVDGTLSGFALTGSVANFVVGQDLTDPCLPLIEGCMDPTACNYDATAQTDDGSCLTIPGCIDPTACNYDASAECDDGSCILPDGCTDDTACNYDPAALCDDGSCDFTSCVGCTDPLADNYEADNTVDDGSCTYCPATLTYNTTIAEPIVIGDGISNNHMAQSANCNVSASIKAVERFVGDIIPTDGLYRVQTGESPVSGIDPTPDPGTARWNYLFSVNLGSFTAEDVKIYLDLDFDPAVGAGSVYTADVSQVLIDNGLGGSSLAQDSQNLGFGFWQLLGDPAILPFDPFANGLYDLTIRVESLAGVELVNAAIQVETFTLGCTNPIACNYDSNATDDDGSCLDILGCTDSGACNYDPAANCDDASCEYTSCLGCTDPTSCDYDPTASIDDGSCLIFPGDACDDGNVYTENDQIQADCGCEGTPIDTDGDGISDEDEINIYGTDPNLQDSDYDGLTDGLEINLAGTNPLDPDGDDDGCGDAESFAGLCPGQEDCIGDFNNDGIVNGADLLTFLGVFGTPCE